MEKIDETKSEFLCVVYHYKNEWRTDKQADWPISDQKRQWMRIIPSWNDAAYGDEELSSALCIMYGYHNVKIRAQVPLGQFALVDIFEVRYIDFHIVLSTFTNKE